MVNERAREILAFIQRFRRESGSSPTIREIGQHFRISSTNGVRYYLNMLEKDGFIRRTGKISRGIGPVAGGTMVAERPRGIPILGRVAAGQPILAEESAEGTLDLGDLFGDTGGMFALRVRGDSMIGAGILPDDHVIVRQQENARAGEIIVALLENEATVKTYQPHRSHIELVAANAKYPPIVVNKDDEFRILGLVRGVVRTVGR